MNSSDNLSPVDLDFNECLKKGKCVMIIRPSEQDELEALCRPLIEFLNNHYHPHVKVIITPVNATLCEEIFSTGLIMDYVKG